MNPIKPEFGSHAFGTDTDGETGRAVTDHGALVGDSGEQAGYLDPNVPLGPTEVEKALMEEMSHARR